jgi:uncharacterized RDD family membrane protein YckC
MEFNYTKVARMYNWRDSSMMAHMPLSLRTVHTTDKVVLLRRLFAGIIDIALLALLQFWIDGIFGLIQGPNTASPVLSGGGLVMSEPSMPAVSLFWLSLIVVAYFFILEALFSTTPGKLVFGLRVVGRDGKHLSVKAAFIRNLLRLVDSWPAYYLVGIVAIWFSPTYQRIGDRLARTSVVSIWSTPFPHFFRFFPGRVAILAILLVSLLAGSWSFTYYHQPPRVIQGWQILNNEWTSNPQTPLPACGKVTIIDNDYVMDPHIASYALSTPQWGNGTITYPITYHPIGGQHVCNGTITLSWQGIFHGGWHVSNVKTP